MSNKDRDSGLSKVADALGVGERSPGYQTALIVAMFITWGIVFLDRMSPLYLAPYLVKDLHFNNAEIGGIASAISVAWGLSAFFFGNISDRVGRRPVLLPMIFIMSVFSWLTGICRNFGQMLAVRFGMGITEGPQANLLIAIVEEEAPPKHRGRNVGIVQSAAGLVGLAVAPVLTTHIAAYFGWRVAFYMLAIPGIIMGIILWGFLKEPARAAQARAAKEKPKYSDVLGDKQIWLTVICCAGFVTWLMVLMAFGPVYLTEIDKFTPVDMGWIMGALGLSGFLWGFGVPWISDRIGRKTALILFGIASAIVPLSILVFKDAYVIAGFGLILSAGQGIAPLVTIIVPAESVGPKLTATAIGLSLMVGELIGGTFMPFISGVLADKFGLFVPMLISSGGMIVLVILTFFLRETAPRFVAKQEATAAVA